MSPEQLKEYKEQFQAWEQQQYDVTIGQYLLRAFPNLFNEVIDMSGGDQYQEADESQQVIKKKKRFDIICHGLKIDMNTPLYWLQLNMGYLDNFVYLSFHSYWSKQPKRYQEDEKRWIENLELNLF